MHQVEPSLAGGAGREIIIYSLLPTYKDVTETIKELDASIVCRTRTEILRRMLYVTLRPLQMWCQLYARRHFSTALKFLVLNDPLLHGHGISSREL
jgi:hypothetical protein